MVKHGQTWPRCGPVLGLGFRVPSSAGQLCGDAASGCFALAKRERRSLVTLCVGGMAPERKTMFCPKGGWNTGVNSTSMISWGEGYCC